MEVQLVSPMNLVDPGGTSKPDANALGGFDAILASAAGLSQPVLDPMMQAMLLAQVSAQVTMLPSPAGISAVPASPSHVISSGPPGIAESPPGRFGIPPVAWNPGIPPGGAPPPILTANLSKTLLFQNDKAQSVDAVLSQASGLNVQTGPGPEAMDPQLKLAFGTTGLPGVWLQESQVPQFRTVQIADQETPSLQPRSPIAQPISLEQAVWEAWTASPQLARSPSMTAPSGHGVDDASMAAKPPVQPAKPALGPSASVVVPPAVASLHPAGTAQPPANPGVAMVLSSPLVDTPFGLEIAHLNSAAEVSIVTPESNMPQVTPMQFMDGDSNVLLTAVHTPGITRLGQTAMPAPIVDATLVVETLARRIEATPVPIQVKQNDLLTQILQTVEPQSLGKESEGSLGEGESRPGQDRSQSPDPSLAHAAIVQQQSKAGRTEFKIPSSSRDTGRMDVVNQISAKLDMAQVKAGVREFTIELRPEHLGRVQVQVQLEGERVLASFRADTPAAQSLLEANRDALREALESKGFTMSGMDVGNGSQSFREFAQPGHSSRTGGPFYGHSDQLEDEDQLRNARNAPRVQHSGRLFTQA